MPITWKAGALRDEMQTLSVFVENRPITDILGMALLQMDPGGSGWHWTATDMESRIRIPSQCIADQQAPLLVPVQKLRDLCAGWEEQAEIQLSVSGRTQKLQVLVRGDNGRLLLSSGDPHSYPAPDPAPASNRITVQSSALLFALQQVAPAIARKDYRVALNGCLFAYENGSLHLTGTDGYRIHHAEIEADTDPADGDFSCSAIMPHGAVEKIRKCVPENTVVDIFMDERGAKIVCGQMEAHIFCLDAGYPNVGKLTRVSSGESVRVAARQLYDSTVLANTISANPDEKVRVGVDRNRLTFSHEEDGSGFSSLVEMPAVYEGGRTFSMRFNARFLATVARLMGEREVQMNFPREPACCFFELRDAQPGVSRIFFLIMPIRA